MYVLKKKCGLFGSTPIYFQLMLTGDLKKKIIVLSVNDTDHRSNTKLWFSFLSLFKCYLFYFLFCSIYLHQDNVLNFSGHT